MAKKSIQERLLDIRANIDALNQRRTDINRALIPETDALANVEKFVKHQTDRAVEKLTIHHLTQAEYRPANTVGLEHLTPLQVQAFLDPGKLKTELGNRVRNRYLQHGDALIISADRSELLKGIEKDILAAEIAEERLIEEAETQGVKFLRRGDASPMVILGLTAADLPLPFGWSTAKLEALTDDADAARAKVKLLSDKWADLRQQRERLKTDANTLTNNNRPIPENLQGDIARVNEHIARVADAYNAASEEATLAGEVANGVEDFVKNHQRPRPVSMTADDYHYAREVAKLRPGTRI